MLKEQRNMEPMLQKLDSALEAEGYSPTTKKSYNWHGKEFLDFCDENRTTPKKISEKLLEKHFENIAASVRKKEVSYPFFLQRTALTEIFYRLVVKDPVKARSIPRIRKGLLSKFGDKLRHPN